MIDEPAARRLFGKRTSGQPVQFANDKERMKRSYAIVGVVRRAANLTDRSPVAHVYCRWDSTTAGTMYARLAGTGEAACSAPCGGRSVRRIARPCPQMRTLRQQRDSNLMLWGVNTGARLFSVFGCVALLLAIIGLRGELPRRVATDALSGSHGAWCNAVSRDVARAARG